LQNLKRFYVKEIAVLKNLEDWQVHSMPKRHSTAQHLTVSGVVLHKEHILLIHHKRIGAWLPPGGHVEEMELPHEAVVREVFEETGVTVDVVSPTIVDTGDPDAFLLPQPLCMHAVYAVEKGVPCYHVDIVYLCRPLRREGSANGDFPGLVDNEEVHGARWMPFDRLVEYPLAKNVLEVLALAGIQVSG
jgi:8-oxo-dGTP diphosphatase